MIEFPGLDKKTHWPGGMLWCWRSLQPSGLLISNTRVFADNGRVPSLHSSLHHDQLRWCWNGKYQHLQVHCGDVTFNYLADLLPGADCVFEGEETGERRGITSTWGVMLGSQDTAQADTLTCHRPETSVEISCWGSPRSRGRQAGTSLQDYWDYCTVMRPDYSWHEVEREERSENNNLSTQIIVLLGPKLTVNISS